MRLQFYLYNASNSGFQIGMVISVFVVLAELFWFMNAKRKHGADKPSNNSHSSNRNRTRRSLTDVGVKTCGSMPNKFAAIA